MLKIHSAPACTYRLRSMRLAAWRTRPSSCLRNSSKDSRYHHWGRSCSAVHHKLLIVLRLSSAQAGSGEALVTSGLHYLAVVQVETAKASVRRSEHEAIDRTVSG